MTNTATMARVREIADAVLYEGYLLYPYRRSAIKNRQRWTYGVVTPREYSYARGGIEPWTMRTECLLEAAADATLDVTVRFLQLLLTTGVELPVAGRAPDTWEEATEREVGASGLALAELVDRPCRIAIDVSGARFVEQAGESRSEPLEAAREQLPLAGAITIAVAPAVADNPRLFKLSVLIENTSSASATAQTAWAGQEGVSPQSFISTHTIVRVLGGAFTSLMDPPEALSEAARSCRNERTWPVLTGDEGDRDMMLSSPIILYDYPQIAPESPGALFDGTEIDEILTLRILTLTDDEKEEMRHGDERTRAILERCEALTADDLMHLHGTIRQLRPLIEGGGA